MPAIEWTQDRPEDDRLHYFALPTGVAHPPLAPESRMSPMRFVGSWEEAAAMGTFRSVASEPAPADLSDALMIWWPSILTSSADRPERSQFYRSARACLDELRALRTTDRAAWWDLLTRIRKKVAETHGSATSASKPPAGWQMPSREFDPGDSGSR